MKNNTLNAIKSNAFNQLNAVGAANGIGNRARTIQSKRDKARDPRRLRREWRNGGGY